MKRSYEAMMLECIMLSEEDLLTTSEETKRNEGFDTPYDEF